MHSFFLVADASEDDHWQAGLNFTDVGNERDTIDFRHVEIDNYYFAVVQLEPGGGLKGFRQGGAGMSSFFQVVGQKPGDQWVVIDDKEIDAIAIEDFHR